MAKTSYLRTLAGKNEKEVRRWKNQYDQKLRDHAMITE